jgi:hypothetical protein
MQQTNAGRVQQKENTTEVAGRMQPQLQEEGCVEKGESKQCNRNSRKNEVFEREESSKQCNREDRAQCYTVADACGRMSICKALLTHKINAEEQHPSQRKYSGKKTLGIIGQFL